MVVYRCRCCHCRSCSMFFWFLFAYKPMHVGTPNFSTCLCALLNYILYVKKIQWQQHIGWVTPNFIAWYEQFVFRLFFFSLSWNKFLKYSHQLCMYMFVLVCGYVYFCLQSTHSINIKDINIALNMSEMWFGNVIRRKWRN